MIEETEELTEELLLRGVKSFLCNKVTQKFTMLIRELNTKDLEKVSADDIKDIFELDNIFTNNCGLYGKGDKKEKEYII